MPQTQTSYDRVAVEYARRFADEMARKPFDCKMLDWLAERVGEGGVICDMGCGPGQVAAYLKQHGAAVCGIDLSPEMVRQASEIHPDIVFAAGNMLDLANVPDSAFAGIAAFYSIIHIPRLQVIKVLETLNRVLKPGGWLLLTFHIGGETRHFNTLWEQAVDLDFHFFYPAAMKDHLHAAGFAVIETIERDPYPPDVEVATRRAYIFAQKLIP